MFHRDILSELQTWRINPRRKPLILRGPRQVGKTSVVHLFGKEFSHYLYLNLEQKEDRQIFENNASTKAILEALFFQKNIPFSEASKALLFIDEIQELPSALNQLRYFYEEFPEICVVAAGSLLETIFNPKLSFPVGRVEYRVVRPVSFPEFLGAMGENQAKSILQNEIVPDYALPKLYNLFHRYALIGGMPEIVKIYAETRDLTLLKPTYEGLLVSYLEDIEKYTSGNAQTNQVRHVARQMFSEAGKRIKFEGFGQSNYRSREMGEAFRILEKAFLLLHLLP